MPEGTRLVSSKPDDGFSDGDENDADSEFGPKAFVYTSDDDDVDSDASENGPIETDDPWGLSLQVSLVLIGNFWTAFLRRFIFHNL